MCLKPAPSIPMCLICTKFLSNSELLSTCLIHILVAFPINIIHRNTQKILFLAFEFPSVQILQSSAHHAATNQSTHRNTQKHTQKYKEIHKKLLFLTFEDPSLQIVQIAAQHDLHQPKTKPLRCSD